MPTTHATARSPYVDAKLSPILRSRWEGKTFFAMLIDPGKQSPCEAVRRSTVAQENGVDLFLVGGSRVPSGSVDATVRAIAPLCKIPLLLFPGADDPEETLVPLADAFLCPLLHNQATRMNVEQWHYKAAQRAFHISLSSIPFSYLLIHEGKPTSSQIEAGIQPFSYRDRELIGDRAFEGEVRGQCLTYLEGGSGAEQPIPDELIQWVWAKTDNPIIVGGGIRTPEVAHQKVRSGASIIVIGTRFEENTDPNLIRSFADAIHISE